MTAPGTVPAPVVRAYAVEIRKLHALLDRLGVPHINDQVASERLERFVVAWETTRAALRKADPQWGR